VEKLSANLRIATTTHLPLDPCHEKIDDPPLSFCGDRGAASHLPPLGEAVTTTASTSVLRLEHGMPAHRRLLPVVRRARRCEPRSDEVLAVGADRLHSLLGDVLPIRFREMEATPELRLPKPGECGIVCVGVHDSKWLSRLRRLRHSGSLASMNAWNLGPCPCAFRWVSS